MSEKFNAYDYIAVIAPGSVIVVGLAVLYLYQGQDISKEQFGIGDLGIFLILAFVFGQLLQAIGNWLEEVFWKCNRSMPTNWVIQPDQSLLSDSQLDRLKQSVQQDFNISFPAISEKDWFNITREINTKIKAANLTERVDTFNRNYGLMRGIAAAFLTLVVLIPLKDWTQWQTSIVCLFFFAAALFRMKRFGIHYAREVFLSYLTLKAN